MNCIAQFALDKFNGGNHSFAICDLINRLSADWRNVNYPLLSQIRKLRNTEIYANGSDAKEPDYKDTLQAQHNEYFADQDQYDFSSNNY